MQKPRLDELVVSKGLAKNINEARGKILAGEILSGDRRLDKAGHRLSPKTPLRWRPRRGHSYVGRGGLKMESALRQLKVNPEGWICMDLGMSTGGFTDCLLQWGASHVYGVDVGRGLAHQRLVQDQRVSIIEGKPTRDLNDQDIPEACDLCVADISFNSLERVVRPSTRFLKPNAHGILLLKPQFELTVQELESFGERGIVHDSSAHELAIQRSIDQLEASGWTLLAYVASETKGTKGNQEYFIHLKWTATH